MFSIANPCSHNEQKMEDTLEEVTWFGLERVYGA
jgi:hypothetical protein